MSTISLCMIVKNEEALLGKFLENIKNYVNEIIIVDTGSKDKTKQIARKFTDKVFDFKWKDDFSAARNKSLIHATKEWILVLDADEVINKKDLVKVKETINNKKKFFKNNKIIGYSFLQKTYTKEKFPFKFVPIKDKKYKGYTFRRITRLFINNKKITFEYPIHESVINSIRRIKGKIKSLDITIYHYPELKTKKDISNKNYYYIKLLKNKIKEHPKAKFHCELGMQYLLIKNKKEAQKYFRKAAELNSYYKRFIKP